MLITKVMNDYVDEEQFNAQLRSLWERKAESEKRCREVGLDPKIIPRSFNADRLMNEAQEKEHVFSNPSGATAHEKKKLTIAAGTAVTDMFTNIRNLVLSVASIVGI